MKHSPFYRYIESQTQANWHVRGEGDTAYIMKSLRDLVVEIPEYALSEAHFRVDQQYSDVNAAMSPWHLTLMFKGESQAEYKIHCYFGWNGEVAVEQVGIVGQTALCKAVTDRLNEEEGPFKAQIDSMSALMAQWRTFCETSRQDKQDKIAALEGLDAQGAVAEWEKGMVNYIEWLKIAIASGAEFQEGEVSLCRNMVTAVKEVAVSNIRRDFEKKLTVRSKSAGAKKKTKNKGSKPALQKVDLAKALNQLEGRFDAMCKLIGQSVTPGELSEHIPALLDLHMQGLSLEWKEVSVLNAQSKTALDKCKDSSQAFEALLRNLLPPLLDTPGGCVAVDLLFGRQTFEAVGSIQGLAEWWHGYREALEVGEADLLVLERVVRYVPEVLFNDGSGPRLVEVVCAEATPKDSVEIVQRLQGEGGGARPHAEMGDLGVLQQCCYQLSDNKSISPEHLRYFSDVLSLLLRVCPIPVLTASVHFGGHTKSRCLPQAMNDPRSGKLGDVVLQSQWWRQKEALDVVLASSALAKDSELRGLFGYMQEARKDHVPQALRKSLFRYIKSMLNFVCVSSKRRMMDEPLRVALLGLLDVLKDHIDIQCETKQRHKIDVENTRHILLQVAKALDGLIVQVTAQEADVDSAVLVNASSGLLVSEGGGAADASDAEQGASFNQAMSKISASTVELFGCFVKIVAQENISLLFEFSFAKKNQALLESLHNVARDYILTDLKKAVAKLDSRELNKEFCKYVSSRDAGRSVEMLKRALTVPIACLKTCKDAGSRRDVADGVCCLLENFASSSFATETQVVITAVLPHFKTMLCEAVDDQYQSYEVCGGHLCVLLGKEMDEQLGPVEAVGQLIAFVKELQGFMESVNVLYSGAWSEVKRDDGRHPNYTELSVLCGGFSECDGEGNHAMIRHFAAMGSVIDALLVIAFKGMSGDSFHAVLRTLAGSPAYRALCSSDPVPEIEGSDSGDVEAEKGASAAP